jgi:hypothetical protein
MRFGSALGVGLLAGMASIPACTPLTFQPASPRRVEGDGVVVEIRRAALRPFVVDVDVAGASPAVDGAWVSRIAAPEGAPCARNLVARSIDKVGSTAAGGSFKVHFDQTVLAALDGSSTLELRVPFRVPSPACDGSWSPGEAIARSPGEGLACGFPWARIAPRRGPISCSCVWAGGGGR